MKKGYDVFGKEYGVMLRNDPHDRNSVEHYLLRNMTLLDGESAGAFYGGQVKFYDMRNHDLYGFAEKFRKADRRASLNAVLEYTADIAEKYDVSIADMLFGGTEREILERGTDWCFDISRAAAVLIDCLGMKARLIFLANPDRAYCGHVVLEVYCDGAWVVCDPLFGYLFPVPARDVRASGQLDRCGDYADYYKQMALCEYDPNGGHIYNISGINEYTLKLNTMEQNGKWLLGEDE